MKTLLIALAVGAVLLVLIDFVWKRYVKGSGQAAPRRQRTRSSSPPYPGATNYATRSGVVWNVDDVLTGMSGGENTNGNGGSEDILAGACGASEDVGGASMNGGNVAPNGDIVGDTGCASGSGD